MMSELLDNAINLINNFDTFLQIPCLFDLRAHLFFLVQCYQETSERQ